MQGKDVNELRELVEMLKANAVTEFAMKREDLEVNLKFAGEPTSSGVDAATLAALLTARPAVVALPAAAEPAGASAGAAAAMPSMQAAAEPAAATPADPLAGARFVKSPIVGTFYAAGSPGAEPFIKAGDRIEVGKVVCIVEAMKLMNEIESDVAGEVVAVLAENGQPVEYGQKLFAVR